MYKLNELGPSSCPKSKKRKGRGIGSGKGKTAGRGQKGQKSRSGVSLNGFAGGQNPIYRRLPKRGFSSQRIDAAKINVSKIEDYIVRGKLDSSKKIDELSLYKAGLFSKKRKPVRLLGDGNLKTPINIEVCFATKTAMKKVIEAGGNINIIHHQEGDDKYYFDSIVLFRKSMNYEVFFDKIDKKRISIVFGASAKQISNPGFSEIDCVIDCPSFGLRDHVLDVGEALRNSENNSCEFNVSLPEFPSEDLVSDDQIIYVALYHKHRMFHRNIISLR